MKLLFTWMMMACVVAYAAEEKKALTPEEIKLQEALEKEYGEYAKECKSAKYYKEVTFQGLKAGKKEYKNKKVQYEGTFMGFNDNFPKYIEESGYSGKKYHYLLVNSVDIPIMSRRSKDMIELLGKIKKGLKVRIYGRVKEFRKEPFNGMMPRYCVELEHVQILELKPKASAAKGKDKGEKVLDDREPRRPKRRR